MTAPVLGSRRVTVLAAASIEAASVPVRTSTFSQALNLSGVITKSLSRSAMTPPA